MMTIDVSVIPQTGSTDGLWEGGADRYDYNRLPAEMRNQAMLAQGTVVEGLSSAVRRVLEAGKALSWAKAELPHGEYLPWVQQACGLKERYARQLVQASNWANRQHAADIEQVTDATTLFLLSAEATPEDVREWFMERASAGDVPTRAEVAERKRSAGRPRQPQPAEALALSILRKGELDRLRAALALAESACAVTPAEVMQEQRLRDLGKLRFIAGMEADFHRMKDGGWIRLPHAGDVDVTPDPIPEPVQPQRQQLELQPIEPTRSEVVSLQEAANRIAVKRVSLNGQLVPSKNPDGITRGGYKITREGRGMVRLTPVAP
jgi:hypothetical protein